MSFLSLIANVFLVLTNIQLYAYHRSLAIPAPEGHILVARSFHNYE